VPIDPDRVRTAARRLLDALEHREPFEPLSADCAPRDFKEAYAIQARLQAMRAPALGPIAGWKVAGTSPARMRLLGLDAPMMGGIHASQVHRGAAVLRAADHVHLGLECEIAFELAVDVPPGTTPSGGGQAARLVGAVMPAFEILDDRGLPYPTPARLVRDAIAANGGNAGLVVGRGTRTWDTTALADLRAQLHVRGRFAGESTARESAGDPLDALAWLVRALSARGVGLPAGTLVTTGSLGPTHFLEAGENAVLEIEGLGEVAVEVV
jgi:2-oxo-3-hexenedioate decarboxylase/2-keto-4-pentenoate hydratase